MAAATGAFWGPDRIAVSPDEGRTGSDLTPEVSGDHLCGALAVGAINQSTSPAEIKAIIRVVIIVLVNTVPENEMLCEPWICPFAVYCIAVWQSFCENSERTVRACELSPCFFFASVFSLFEKSWRPSRSGFLQSQGGYTLSIATVVGVLTDCAVGSRGRKNVMVILVFMLLSLRSINY